MNKLYLLLAASIACSGPALAQQSGGIGSVTVSPSPAKVGQPVTITVNAEGDAPKFCGLTIEFGDSEARDLKVGSNQGTVQFPVIQTKTFNRPGTFNIVAKGKKVTTHLPCQGKAETKIVIEGAAPAVAAATCPNGYKLQGKLGKAGDFSCKAGKGAKAPERTLSCKDGLEYFQTKSNLGCRKVKATKKK
jgi:hypothetical protein